MPGQVVHIHVGPSKLGLGLVASTTAQLRMEVHIVGRPGPDSTPRFGVSLVPNLPIAFHDVASFTGPETFKEAGPALREAVMRDGPLLVTCTLRDGIVDRYQFVRELLLARGDGETVFIACENSPHEAYGRLRQEFEPGGVRFLDTVVNRICPKFIRISGPRRIVRAHKLGEWLIEERLDDSAVIECLTGSDFVLLEPELEPFKRRKRWQVNGGQLLLAMLAHQAGESDLLRATRTPGVLSPVDHFHAEVNRVLLARYPQLDGNLEFAMKHVKAFCEITDDVARMIAVQREDLSPFFRTFESRIAEPARLATEMAGGSTPEIFELALAVLDELLAEPRAYDWSSRADPDVPAKLDEATDRNAVKTYEQMLEGWQSSEAMEERVERLEAILSSHRNRGAPFNHRIKPI